MVYRNSAADCLRPPLSDTLPPQCQQLKKGFGECRRGMIDMRKRFRGNQPAAAKLLITKPEGATGEHDAAGADAAPSSSKGGYQLYAGRSAFGGVVRETSGNEKAPADWRELENERYRKEQEAKKR